MVAKVWVGVLLVPLLLGACCAPDTCRPARVGFVALEPVTEAISAHTDRTGQPPETLRELFPEGLPEGLAWGEGPGEAQEFVTFEVPRWDRVGVSYGPVFWPDPPEGVDAEYHELTFRYDASSRNSCRWTTDERQWECGGYY